MLANRNRALRRGGLPFLGVLVLALASLGLITTGVSASSEPDAGQVPGADAQVAGGPTEVFQCFGLARGDDPIAAAYLETQNFGFDAVVIRTSNMMCETAFKFTDPAQDVFKPQLGQVLQCWKTAKGKDVNDDVLLTTDNFGTTKATVRRAVMMCESALKFRLGTTLPPYGGLFGSVWQCFNLVDTTPTPNLPAVVVTNNFGRDRAEIGRAVLMCETARKIRPTATAGTIMLGEPTGAVVECRTFNPPEDHLAPVGLETFNFGLDNAVVRQSKLVCESAHKERIGLPTIKG